MIVDIELTRRADGYYVARALHIPNMVIEAESRDAALEQMRATLVSRRQAGVELVQLDIGDEGETVPATWPRHAGAFPDDEAYREMIDEVERQRHVLDPIPFK
jgi:hypothetical protein